MAQSTSRPEQALPRLASPSTPPHCRPRTGVGEFCFCVLEALSAHPNLDVGVGLSRSGRGGIADLLPPGVRALGWAGPGLPGRVTASVGGVGVSRPWSSTRAVLRWSTAPTTSSLQHATPTVVTVHDLTPLHYPQRRRPAARGLPRAWSQGGEPGVPGVHADSDFVARELTAALGVPASVVRTVHLGVRQQAAPLGPGAASLERAGPCSVTLRGRL